MLVLFLFCFGLFFTVWSRVATFLAIPSIVFCNSRSSKPLVKAHHKSPSFTLPLDVKTQIESRMNRCRGRTRHPLLLPCPPCWHFQVTYRQPPSVPQPKRATESSWDLIENTFFHWQVRRDDWERFQGVDRLCPGRSTDGNTLSSRAQCPLKESGLAAESGGNTGKRSQLEASEILELRSRPCPNGNIDVFFLSRGRKKSRPHVGRW